MGVSSNIDMLASKLTCTEKYNEDTAKPSVRNLMLGVRSGTVSD